MTPERQIEAMAKIEFGENLKRVKLDMWDDEVWTVVDIVGFTHERDYLTDYNAVHRVLRGMDAVMADSYDYELEKIATPEGILTAGGVMVNANIVWSTCAQMTEAILRAHGVWEEDEEGGGNAREPKRSRANETRKTDRWRDNCKEVTCARI